jgi:predicted metal-dependent phosphoesterase TrpH
MTVDLHVHTTASDGLVTPSGIVTAALDLGLRVVSITDHDSVEGVSEAIDAARGTALDVLPGVELSVRAGDGSDVHVLGYLIDHGDPELLGALKRLRTARFERARAMVQALAEAGHDVDLGGVLEHAAGGAVGRVHVARALVDAGSVASIEQAFADLIGREGPYYVRKAFFSPEEALALIHGAGGVAVLAHPGVSGESSLVPFIDAGLDGIEAYHAEHTSAQRAHFAALAKRFGLVATGGSDFHGPGMRSAALGSGACPDSAVEALRERANILRP